MSYGISKYIIHYDANDGTTTDKEIYCKRNNTCDTQQWLLSDGTPVTFECITDSGAEVLAKCILGIPTYDPDFYWEEVVGYTLPDCVAKAFI